MSNVIFARTSGETIWKWNGDHWSTIHSMQHPWNRARTSPVWKWNGDHWSTIHSMQHPWNRARTSPGPVWKWNGDHWSAIHSMQHPWNRATTSPEPVWKWNGDHGSTIHSMQHPWYRATPSPGWNEDNYENSFKMPVIVLGITVSVVIVFLIVFIVRCTKNFCGSKGCGSGDESILTSSTPHVPLRSNVHRPRSANPYRSAPNSSEQQFQTHSSEFYSPSLHEERFLRTDGMHLPQSANPYRSAPNSREQQQFQTHSSEFYSPSLYLENFSRTGGMQNSPPRTSDFAVSSSDQPPDYSVVIISDLSQKDKFPEVHPAQTLDLPPPKYEDTSLMKF